METNGAKFEVEITPLGAGTFGFEAEREGAILAGTVNPVEVMLRVGDDAGTVSVIAEFDDDDDSDDSSDDESKGDDSSDNKSKEDDSSDDDSSE